MLSENLRQIYFFSFKNPLQNGKNKRFSKCNGKKKPKSKVKQRIFLISFSGKTFKDFLVNLS